MTFAAIALVTSAAMAPQGGARAEVKAQVGKTAPTFSLPSTANKTVTLDEFKGKYVVLEWTNHGCPVVVNHYRSGNMQKQQAMAKDMDVVWLSIVSSKTGAQGAVTPDEGEAIRKEQSFNSMATLLDPSGATGKAYGARTTPHMYVIDPKGVLIYNGAIDDNARGDKSAPRMHVIEALKEAKAGKDVSVKTSQPYGCGIKY